MFSFLSYDTFYRRLFMQITPYLVSFETLGSSVEVQIKFCGFEQNMFGENGPTGRYLTAVQKPWLYLLVFEVFHQARHLMQVRLQFDLFMTQAVQLLTQVGDVSFKHGINVGARCGLFLKKFPFGLKHFVLLL